MITPLLASAAALTVLLTGPGPCVPVTGDVASRVKAAGLTMLDEEAMAMHIHPHLTVYVDGRRVPVPADVGIDRTGPKPRYSPLHTHDRSGKLHVESAVWRDFTLGQFLVEWGVRCSGGRATVDGVAFRGDPSRIVLHDKDDIKLFYGVGTVSSTSASKQVRSPV
ncbi:hypothetical protein [Streptomyces sp. NPDC050738]|uniref:hypothetical protein n=1 Tax=Streptomyces sp. NPDC050738 TaxID=3154744 RepID=UPI00341AF3BB